MIYHQLGKLIFKFCSVTCVYLDKVYRIGSNKEYLLHSAERVQRKTNINFNSKL